MTYIIRVYYSDTEEVAIKKEFEDSSFDSLNDCFEYYREKYKFNNISVSPMMEDNETLGEALHRLNEDRKS